LVSSDKNENFIDEELKIKSYLETPQLGGALKSEELRYGLFNLNLQPSEIEQATEKTTVIITNS